MSFPAGEMRRFRAAVARFGQLAQLVRALRSHSKKELHVVRDVSRKFISKHRKKHLPMVGSALTG